MNDMHDVLAELIAEWEAEIRSLETAQRQAATQSAQPLTPSEQLLLNLQLRRAQQSQTLLCGLAHLAA